MDSLDGASFDAGSSAAALGSDPGSSADATSPDAQASWGQAMADAGVGGEGGSDSWGNPSSDTLDWSGVGTPALGGTGTDGVTDLIDQERDAVGDAPSLTLAAATPSNTPGTAAPAAAATDGPGQPADDKDKRDTSPSLSDVPTPPGPGTPPPSASAPVPAAPGCHFFQGAGQVGGALLGGTVEGLRQAAPGALAGGLAGAGAGAWRGALAGAAAGLPEGGVGALPGAGLGGAGGALRGSVAGAVVGGTPGFVKGFGEGAGPGAAVGAGAGSWLDNTSFGRWVQRCPAPDTVKPADGLQGPQVVTMAQNTSRPYPASQDAQDRARSQQLGYTEPEYDALAEDPDHAGQVNDNSQ